MPGTHEERAEVRANRVRVFVVCRECMRDHEAAPSPHQITRTCPHPSARSLHLSILSAIWPARLPHLQNLLARMHTTNHAPGTRVRASSVEWKVAVISSGGQLRGMNSSRLSEAKRLMLSMMEANSGGYGMEKVTARRARESSGPPRCRAWQRKRQCWEVNAHPAIEMLAWRTPERAENLEERDEDLEVHVQRRKQRGRRHAELLLVGASDAAGERARRPSQLCHGRLSGGLFVPLRGVCIRIGIPQPSHIDHLV